MRSVIFDAMACALTLLLANAIAAQQHSRDPIIGTWKLNAAQSTWFPGAVPSKEQTEIYKEIEGNRVELTTFRLRVDGSKRNARYSFPVEGGMMILEAGEGPADGDSTIEVRLSAHEWYGVLLRKGRQVQTRQKLISKDGKTIRHTLRTIEQGKEIEWVQVFDKQ